MFHGQVNSQVICFFTRSFDLAWPGVAPPLEKINIYILLLRAYVVRGFDVV